MATGRKATKPDLMQVALAKLNQRDRTKEQLRQLLTRKLSEPGREKGRQKGRTREPGGQDADEQSGQDAAAGAREIDEVLSRLEDSGVIDDRRFAEHFTRSARGKGASAAKVQQKLGQRGIAKDGIDQALQTLSSEGLDDLAAARRYAQRRRLAQRYDLADPKERQKALASLARQGFSITTALRALDADGRDDVDS